MSNFVWAMNEMSKGSKVTLDDKGYLYIDSEGKMCNHLGRLAMGIGVTLLNSDKWRLWEDKHRLTPREVEVINHALGLGFTTLWRSSWTEKLYIRAGERFGSLPIDHIENIFMWIDKDKNYDMRKMLKENEV